MSSPYHNHGKLFSDFAKSSKKDWEDLLKSALSLHDFEKLLSPEEVEGVPLRSILTSEDLDKKTTEKNALSYTVQGRKWAFQEIVQIKERAGEHDANRTTLRALSGGVESLLFDVSKVEYVHVDTDVVLSEVLRDAVDISWYLSSDGPLPEAVSLKSMRGVLYLNPIETYMTQGIPYHNGLKKLLQLLQGDYDTYRCLSVSGYEIANSGASIVEEVGLTGNILIEYLDYLTEHGIAPKVLFDNLEITLSTRTSFLADISKFRAMAIVIRKIAEAYKVELSKPPLIRAVSAVYNKAAYDLNTNLLRNTTEALGAILGNCSTINLLPHNGSLEGSQEFGRRIARNISHLLREESRLGLVEDPLAGAYAIEQATHEISEKAWSLLQKVEAKGGLLAQFDSGKLQAMIQQSASSYLEDIASLKKITVGANRYVPGDVTAAQQDHFINIDLRQHQPPLLSFIRGAAPTEGIRKMVDQEVSQGKPRPVLGIVPYSVGTKPAVFAARSAFVKDILHSIGIDTMIIPNQVFVTNKGLGNELKRFQALVVVGGDAEYEKADDRVFSDSSAAFEIPIIIAGYPPAMALQTQVFGIYAFVHANMNVPAFADKFLEDIYFFDL